MRNGLFNKDNLLDHHGHVQWLRRHAAADAGDMTEAPFFQHLLHAANGEAIGLKQAANTTQQIYIFGTIKAPAAGPLHRLDLGETAFPEAQNMLRHIKLQGDFADGAKGVRRLEGRGESC
jgi:hypothetical protein